MVCSGMVKVIIACVKALTKSSLEVQEFVNIEDPYQVSNKFESTSFLEMTSECTLV